MERTVVPLAVLVVMLAPVGYGLQRRHAAAATATTSADGATAVTPALPNRQVEPDSGAHKREFVINDDARPPHHGDQPIPPAQKAEPTKSTSEKETHEHPQQKADNRPNGIVMGHETQLLNAHDEETSKYDEHPAPAPAPKADPATKDPSKDKTTTPPDHDHDHPGGNGGGGGASHGGSGGGGSHDFPGGEGPDRGGRKN